MSKIKWDQLGEKTYETGIDHGVLYPQKNGTYPQGYAWNGITSISENPSGAEETKLYADNIPYLSLRSAEEFGLTIECYTYPAEWSECNGESELEKGIILGQQRRNTFGLCYRTKKGNDTEGEDYGFIYHLVYGCSSAPSERSYESVNDSPDAITFSFEVSTTPVDVPGKDSTGKPFKPTSLIKIDSTLADAETIAKLEEILFGTDGVGEDGVGTEPRLPLPSELKTLLAAG